MKNTFKNKFLNFIEEWGIICLIGIPFVVLLLFLLIPVTQKGEINSFGWQYSITIEELTEVERSGYEVPKGATVTRKYTRKKDDSEVPYYDYTVEEYVPVDYVITSGEDKSPYWGTVKLGQNQKEGLHQSRYYVYLQTDKGLVQYNMNREDWTDAEIKGTIKFHRFRFGKHIWGITID